MGLGFVGAYKMPAATERATTVARTRGRAGQAWRTGRLAGVMLNLKYHGHSPPGCGPPISPGGRARAPLSAQVAPSRFQRVGVMVQTAGPDGRGRLSYAVLVLPLFTVRSLEHLRVPIRPLGRMGGCG